MNTENKPVYFTKDQLKQHLESRGINTNAKAQPIIDQLVKKGAVIEGYNDQPKPNVAQSVAGGLIKAPTDIIGTGFAGIGALGSYTGKKLAGLDTTLAQEYANQSQQVQESGANSIIQPITGEKIRPAQNLEQLGGDVLQTGALAIPGGAIGKGASTLGKIGTGLAYGAAAGGGAGAGMAMSENATLEEIVKRGLIGTSLGGTLGAAIPVVPALANLAKKTPDAYQAAKGLRSNLQAYVGSKTVQPTFGTAATRLTGSATRLETPLSSYQKYEPIAQQAISDTKVDAPISIVGSEIGDAFKKVIDDRRAIGNIMGQELKAVGSLKTDIEPIFVNFETALNDAGLTYNGLSKKIVASDLSKVAPDDIAIIEDFVKELNRIGTTPKVAQIDALISRMNDKISYAKSARGMVGTTNGERLVKATLNSLRNKFDEIPELATYAKARKDYAELSDFIDEGAGFLGKVTQSGDFAKDASIAKSAVQSILNNGKKDWLLKLEALTDYPALDEATLALQAMKDAGDFRGLSLLETLSEGALPTSKARFTQKLIDYIAQTGARVTTGSPAERTKAFLQSLEKTLKPTAPKSINKNTIIPASGVKKMPIKSGINKSDAVITKTILQKTNVATEAFKNFERDTALVGENAQIQEKSIEKYLNNKETLLKDYLAENGKIVNTDEARKLFKDVGYRGSNAAAVQEASSALSKDAWRNLLSKSKGKDVLIYAGGSGTGKTSAVKNILPNEIKDATAILDGNLSSMKSAEARIKEALEAGADPHIIYVYRTPEESWVEGVIKRMNENKEEGGRLVPLSVFLDNHAGSYNVVKNLRNAGVDVKMVDNSLGKGNQTLLSPKKFDSIKYDTATKDKLLKITKDLYEQGKINQEQYEALIK